MSGLTLSLIDQAVSFLEGKIRKTPMEFSAVLSECLKVPVYLKLECLQTTGSFKVRGALFYLSTLKAEERDSGVAACSAGNHGLGVAFAAKELGVPCTLFVPKSVDQAKYEKMLKLGATVKKSKFSGYDDTLEWAEEEAAKDHLHLISAFDDARIMAGNGGSLGYEILKEVPAVQNVVVPVGGGGLCSGIAYSIKAERPNARIIGCQHLESPALHLSLQSGVAVTRLTSVETVAGGIEGGIGERCFEILKHRIDEVALLSEQEIIKAFCWILEHHQYLIEPTAAVGVAACLFNKISHLNGPMVIILTGRNVSFQTLRTLVAFERNDR
ncbi:MAG: threonine ammonia-lyase [Anaerolineae bacterium]